MAKRFISEESRIRKNKKTAERYAENKEKYSKYHKELRERKKIEDPEFQKKEAERAKAWRENNLEKAKESAKRSREKHAEKRKQEVRDWFVNNKDKRAFYQKNRTSAIKNRLPSWASLQAIEYFYAYAKMLTSITKIKHVVDHIIPLQGHTESGLHVENNLMVITANLNQRKHNKIDFDFGDESKAAQITNSQALSYLFPEIVEKVNSIAADRGVKIPVSKREAVAYEYGGNYV